ncbi:hypothetical protein [Winogradskyella sp. PE311]|uniref:hypothetical protein n=1 Tax=Winogradskyella sp. PE311 TaxID=3366943 RepID=UPI00397F90AA
MIKKRNLIMPIIVLILSYSCSSEDNTSDLQTDNFYALTLGNSWNYKYYLKDMDTNVFLPTPVTETVDITETIEIDNNTYYNFKHIVTGNDGNYGMLPSNGEKNFTLRDSLGYLIDEIGLIKYTHTSNDEHFVDYNTESGGFAYYLDLSEALDNVTTNAGSFSCYDNHYYFKDSNGTLSNSVDHIYREDGIGEILSTMSYMSQSDHFAEKRLEFYSLE